MAAKPEVLTASFLLQIETPFQSRSGATS